MNSDGARTIQKVQIQMELDKSLTQCPMSRAYSVESKRIEGVSDGELQKFAFKSNRGMVRSIEVHIHSYNDDEKRIASILISFFGII